MTWNTEFSHTCWLILNDAAPNRRAVPREVGPPPGGPSEVRTHIPVVFFTARGIPGEVSEGMESVEGAMAACMRALTTNGALPLSSVNNKRTA